MNPGKDSRGGWADLGGADQCPRCSQAKGVEIMSMLTTFLWTIGIIGSLTAATWGVAPVVEAPRHQQANAPVRLSRWWWIVMGIESMLAGVGLVWLLQMPCGMTCVVLLLFLIGNVGVYPLSGWVLPG